MIFSSRQISPSETALAFSPMPLTRRIKTNNGTLSASKFTALLNHGGVLVNNSRAPLNHDSLPLSNSSTLLNHEVTLVNHNTALLNHGYVPLSNSRTP